MNARNGKRRKNPKVSKGVHGGGGKGRPLTEVEKANMGGGIVRTFRPIGTRGPVVEVVKPDVETAKRAMRQIATRKAAS